MAHQDPHTFKEIFTPLGTALAVFGGLGGLVRALVVKSSWREGVRVVLVGAGTAFGLGVMSPVALRAAIHDIPTEPSGALGALCAAAFLVGVIAVALVERFIRASETSSKPKE